MLDCIDLAQRLQWAQEGKNDGLSVIPFPDTEKLRASGEASISLRLGRWLIALRQSSQTSFDVDADPTTTADEAKAAKKYFVPFGQEFVLHPGRFVLAATLEWLKFPNSLAGYVAGKSTWARRGLIIETAAGIHPGFSGCITLELANVGEVPIKIRPGMSICQVFVHPLSNGKFGTDSSLKGKRKPYLGTPKADEILKLLRDQHRLP